MIHKKKLTTLQWAIFSLVLFVPGACIAVLMAMGKTPTFDFIVSVAFGTFVICLAIWCSITNVKINLTTDEHKMKADELAGKKEYAAAIRIWKKLLPQVGEPHVREILPKLEKVYQELKNSQGVFAVNELTKVYNNFYEMNKLLKKLDPKSKIMRQTLAEKICETVNNLPES